MPGFSHGSYCLDLGARILLVTAVFTCPPYPQPPLTFQIAISALSVLSHCWWWSHHSWLGDSVYPVILSRGETTASRGLYFLSFQEVTLESLCFLSVLNFNSGFIQLSIFRLFLSY